MAIIPLPQRTPRPAPHTDRCQATQQIHHGDGTAPIYCKLPPGHTEPHKAAITISWANIADGTLTYDCPQCHKAVTIPDQNQAIPADAPGKHALHRRAELRQA